MSSHEYVPELRIGRPCPRCGTELVGGTHFLYGDTIDECPRCGYFHRVPRVRGTPDGERKAAPRTEAVFAFGGIA
jgi:DNA-directed RNA polymerase subunit RPC12/RpoP